MELEFDKEIDAILRKAEAPRGVLVGDDPPVPKKHLDADVIAAFAENALPEKAKLLYIEHFADCDRCRNVLSQTILMNTEAASSVKEAASVIAAPVAEASSVPWYLGLLKTQNLALTMGALVLVFTGVLGYIMLQNQNSESNASVSQVTEPDSPKGGPYFNGESANAAANTAINSNAASGASNTIAPNPNTAPYDAPTDQPTVATTGRPNTSSDTAIRPADRGDSLDEQKKAEKDDKTVTVGGAVTSSAKPAAPKEQLPVNGRSVAESVTVDGVDAKDDALAKRKQTENRRETTRDLPMAASKVGPSRAGPLQNQSNQTNNGIFDMSVKRTISGKTFENRDRVWYDSAYHGQATTNVRRGNDEYKKLDGGLRNIANSLGGTVVIVWKEKAYRIQ